MSWNVTVVGKASAVAAKVAQDLERIKCSEPEETIKNTAASIIATALAAYPEGYAVKVEASGSQGPGYSSTGQQLGGQVNSLNLKIEPVYGFVE